LILIFGYYFDAAHTRARYLLLVSADLGNAAPMFYCLRAAILAPVTSVCF